MDRVSCAAKLSTPKRPFDFSQASLQDYIDCARRFQLRYLQQLHWPAPQAEPIRENEAAHPPRRALSPPGPAGAAGRAARAAGPRSPRPIPTQTWRRWWDSFTGLLPSLQAGERQRGDAAQRPARPAPPAGQVRPGPDLPRRKARRDLGLEDLPNIARAAPGWKNACRRRVYPYLLARAGALAQRRAALPARADRDGLLVYCHPR